MSILKWTSSASTASQVGSLREYVEKFERYYLLKREEYLSFEEARNELNLVLHGYLLRVVITEGDFSEAQHRVDAFFTEHVEDMERLWDLWEGHYHEQNLTDEQETQKEGL